MIRKLLTIKKPATNIQRQLLNAPAVFIPQSLLGSLGISSAKAADRGNPGEKSVHLIPTVIAREQQRPRQSRKPSINVSLLNNYNRLHVIPRRIGPRANVFLGVIPWLDHGNQVKYDICIIITWVPRSKLHTKTLFLRGPIRHGMTIVQKNRAVYSSIIARER